MRGHKARRAATGIDIPCAADVQDRAVGRGERAIDSVTDAMARVLRLDHFIFPRVLQQRISQLNQLAQH